MGIATTSSFLSASLFPSLPRKEQAPMGHHPNRTQHNQPQTLTSRLGEACPRRKRVPGAGRNVSHPNSHSQKCPQKAKATAYQLCRGLSADLYRLPAAAPGSVSPHGFLNHDILVSSTPLHPTILTLALPWDSLSSKGRAWMETSNLHPLFALCLAVDLCTCPHLLPVAV